MEHMKVSTKKWKMGYFENVKRREPFLDIDYEELESCTSIPKSSFSKKKKKRIKKALMLSINTGKKYLKYSIHFAYICDYRP